MSGARRAPRPRADHQQAADRLRTRPGVWDVVHTYASNYSASSTAQRIRAAAIPVYGPAGSFETSLEPRADGMTAVLARYAAGEPTLPAAVRECACCDRPARPDSAWCSWTCRGLDDPHDSDDHTAVEED